MERNRRSISLFSGAMGLDIGLEQAGIKTLTCVEINEDAVSTIRRNRPSLPVLNKSVQDISAEELREVSGIGDSDLDLLAGGPPSIF